MATPNRIPGRIFAVCCLAFFIWVLFDLQRALSLPDDEYFESLLSRKLANAGSMQEFACETMNRDDDGYTVRCSVRKDGVEQHYTSHWFALNGDYIGSFDGG